MQEPRFINPSNNPVRVRDPQGNVRLVRPYRELAAFSWRKEEDCIAVGAHYANFPGLLAPFPEPEQAAPAAQAVQAGAQAGVAAVAPKGRFRGTGDVVRPDGSVKNEGDQDTATAPDPDAADGTEDERDELDGGEGDAEPEHDLADDDEDRPLEDLPGMTAVLAAALRAAGYETVLSLADCQTKTKLKKLGKVSGVDDAQALVDAAHKLLDWD